MTWEWHRNDGHRKQPILEFYLEQLVMYLTLYICRAAHQRDDTVTKNRMIALARSASDHETDD